MKKILITIAILILAMMPVNVFAGETITEADCEMVTAESEETTSVDEKDNEPSAEVSSADDGEQLPDDTDQPASEKEPESIAEDAPAAEPATEPEEPTVKTEEASETGPLTAEEPTVDAQPAKKPEKTKAEKPATPAAPTPMEIAKARISEAVRNGQEQIDLSDLGIKYIDTDDFYFELMLGVYLEGVSDTLLIDADDGTLATIVVVYGEYCEDDEDCEEDYGDDNDEDEEKRPSEHKETEKTASNDAVITEDVPETQDTAPVISSSSECSGPMLPAGSNVPEKTASPFGAMSLSVMIAGILKYLLH